MSNEFAVETLLEIWLDMLKEYEDVRIEELATAFTEETGWKHVWEELDGYFTQTETDPTLMVWVNPSHWEFERAEQHG